MKKIFISLLLIVLGFAGFSQGSTTVDYATYDSNGMAFKKRTDTLITPPYNPDYVFNGNKQFMNLDSAVRKALSATSPLSFNNTTGVISSQAASGSQNGYLTSTDWTTFNSKIGITSPVNGDIVYYNSGWQKLGIGTNGQHLKIVSGLPAWVDTTAGGGGGGTPAGSTNYIQYNNGGAFGASSLFQYNDTGITVSTKLYAGLYVTPTSKAKANTDTLVGIAIINSYNPNGKTGVVHQAIRINRDFIDIDSSHNLTIGIGNAARPASGNVVFIGPNTGLGATSATNSVFIGNDAGDGASGSSFSNMFGNLSGNGASATSYSNFFGYASGYGSTNADHSNFFGKNAGQSGTNASNSNFFGSAAGQNATNASNCNFFGQFAGYNASGVSFSNFFGYQAGYLSTTPSYSNLFGSSAGSSITGSSNNLNIFGQNAGRGLTGSTNSNFFGQNAGDNAVTASYVNFFGAYAGYFDTSASYSNFFGNQAGRLATNAFYSNFFGNSAGQNATNASYSNFLGNQAGTGATGASYSNFFGYQAGDSLLFKITGSNNILIGTNITTPTASSSNTLNIGNVLYGTNTYSNAATQSATAQTNGQIGINVTTPDASSALEVKSTIAGVLLPRMTTAQRNAISSPATGLTLYCTDCTATDASTGVMQTYNGSTWKNNW